MRQVAFFFCSGILALLLGCSSEEPPTENPDPTFLKFDINQVAQTFNSSDSEERNLWILQTSGYEEPVERESLGETIRGLPPECRLIRGGPAASAPTEGDPMVTLQAGELDSTVPVGAESRIRVGTEVLESIKVTFEATSDRSALTVEEDIPAPYDRDFDLVNMRWTGPSIAFNIRTGEPLYFSVAFSDAVLECDGLTEDEFELDLVVNDLGFDPTQENISVWNQHDIELDFGNGSTGILTLRSTIETAANVSCASLSTESCQKAAGSGVDASAARCFVLGLTLWDDEASCYGPDGELFCLPTGADADGVHSFVEFPDGSCYISPPIQLAPGGSSFVDGCGCDVEPGAGCGSDSPVYCE